MAEVAAGSAESAEPESRPAVVVGIDGSRAAVRAALWAVEEAVSRDVPLRLIAVAEGRNTGSPAEAALRAAADAVRSAGAGVRVQTRAVDGAPTAVLVAASRTAVMVCVGAVGLKHLGSTARALAVSAHCPVAVVRDSHRPAAAGPGQVVAALDETPDSAAVLQCGVEEARLRGMALRVLGVWPSHAGATETTAEADGNRVVRAQLDRRMSQWRHRYPDLDAQPVAVHGTVLGYLAEHSGAVRLVVIGARNAAGVGALLGPSGLAALHDTECSILVVDPQRLL